MPEDVPRPTLASTTYRNTYLEARDTDTDGVVELVACGISVGFTHDTPDDAISTLRRLVDAFHASAAGAT